MFDQSGQRKYLNPAERELFRRAADPLPLPKKAFCLTLLLTGCRISEALNMTFGQIDARARIVVFRTLKQRKSVRHRAVHVPIPLLNLLRGIQQSRSAAPDERVWTFCRTTAWKLIKRTMASAGIEGIKSAPKGLRHGYAIANVSGNVPVPKVQKWLGHESLETTSIYLDFMGEDDRALASRIWPDALKDEHAHDGIRPE